MSPFRVAVIGDGACSEATAAQARKLGELLARRGFAIICGGLGGVMRAACEGARIAGGRTIGLVPGKERGEANEFVEIPIATGLGPMRNYLVVLNADIVVAVEGGYGTLSEIALARKIGRRVVVLGHWSAIEGVIPASSPEEAVETVSKALSEVNQPYEP